MYNATFGCLALQEREGKIKVHMQPTPLHTHARYLHGGHVIKSTVLLFSNGLALGFCAFVCGCTHRDQKGHVESCGKASLGTFEPPTFQTIDRLLQFGHWSLAKLSTGLSLRKKNSQDVTNIQNIPTWTTLSAKCSQLCKVFLSYKRTVWQFWTLTN